MICHFWQQVDMMPLSNKRMLNAKVSHGTENKSTMSATWVLLQTNTAGQHILTSLVYKCRNTHLNRHEKEESMEFIMCQTAFILSILRVHMYSHMIIA